MVAKEDEVLYDDEDRRYQVSPDESIICKTESVPSVARAFRGSGLQARREYII